jgi:pimeloyl-ACP methyl ester carboxylesterase
VCDQLARILICAFVIVTAIGADLNWADASEPARRNLTQLVLHYIDESEAEQAERTLQDILSNPDASIDTITRLIQTGREYGPQPIGSMSDERVDVQGRIYHLALFVPQTYHPSKGYALVVCLHGAGFSGEAYLERWQARLAEDYVLACPTYPAGAWFTRRAEELVMTTIRAVQRRYHIDPDRIFLTGMSNGGIGTWLIGMHQAPTFAGIAPMASGLDDILMPFLANLQSTPVYMIHGAKDQVMPVELSRAISRELAALGYPHVYREHQREHPMAGGHYFPREELPELVKWFNAQRRNPYPTTIRLVREASHFQAFGWVRIDATDEIAAFSEDLINKRDDLTKHKQYAKLEASIVTPNRIEVATKRVQHYSLFLNEHLIDSTKPLTVVTNGQVLFEGPVTPSLEILLRQARLRQDPRQLFPIHVMISVPKQAS